MNPLWLQNYGLGSPGRAALIMSLLKTGELPAVPLSKHQLSSSSEGSREKL